jgi:hypothetical protein
MLKDTGPAVNKKPPGSGEMLHFQGLRLPGADFLGRSRGGLKNYNYGGSGKLFHQHGFQDENQCQWKINKIKQAVREHANKMRTRRPRPYLYKYKQAPNSPECPVGANCQGRGGVPPPAAIRSLKIMNFEFSDSLKLSR